MCRYRAARAVQLLLVGLSSLALCFAIGVPQAAAHGGHRHHGHAAHGSGQHLTAQHHGDRHHRHHDGRRGHDPHHPARGHHEDRDHRNPNFRTPAPSRHPSSTRAPEPNPSATPTSTAVTVPTTSASTHTRARATARAALAVPRAAISLRLLDPPSLHNAPMSGISLPSPPRTTTRPAGTVSVNAVITPHRSALPAANAQVALFGLDDSVLIGGVLVVLTLGVAVVVAGAGRPRRHH
jgi:hypothetical protein